MKTGGMTLRQIVRCAYAPGRVHEVVENHFDLFSVPSLTGIDLDQVDVLQGHVPHGVHELLPRPATYVTLLREPVDRAVSLYFHWRRKLGARFGEHGIVEGLSAVLADDASGLVPPVRLLEIDNAQTRRISGLNPPLGACSRQMLVTAKRNLRKDFTVIGLTERFDETVLMLARRFGWPWACYVRANVTERRLRVSQVPASLREELRTRNALDVELYNYAAELFERELAAEPRGFARRLQAFRRLNRDFQRRLATPHVAASVRRSGRELLLAANVHAYRCDVELLRDRSLATKREIEHERLVDRLEAQARRARLAAPEAAELVERLGALLEGDGARPDDTSTTIRHR